ncbi:hypothetical protein [Streptomyces sp. SM8]|jgi:hypothetical protein|uniref:hypothetical protein n=1 Tax=Streptomyces sp. SM8 TaxID=1195457 RepID=UPI0002831136|nr:hypothetical protein [Streptomyces sp. SM8]PKA37944.1 hypothetical protein SM8_029440 [Streptomyces sp. SM8]
MADIKIGHVYTSTERVGRLVTVTNVWNDKSGEFGPFVDLDVHTLNGRAQSATHGITMNTALFNKLYRPAPAGTELTIPVRDVRAGDRFTLHGRDRVAASGAEYVGFTACVIELEGGGVAYRSATSTLTVKRGLVDEEQPCGTA